MCFLSEDTSHCIYIGEEMQFILDTRLYAYLLNIFPVMQRCAAGLLSSHGQTKEHVFT